MSREYFHCAFTAGQEIVTCLSHLSSLNLARITYSQVLITSEKQRFIKKFLPSSLSASYKIQPLSFRMMSREYFHCAVTASQEMVILPFQFVQFSFTSYNLFSSRNHLEASPLKSKDLVRRLCHNLSAPVTRSKPSNLEWSFKCSAIVVSQLAKLWWLAFPICQVQH